MNQWLVPGPVFLPLHQEPTPRAHIPTWFQPAERCLTPQAGPAFPVGPRAPWPFCSLRYCLALPLVLMTLLSPCSSWRFLKT